MIWSLKGLRCDCSNDTQWISLAKITDPWCLKVLCITNLQSLFTLKNMNQNQINLNNDYLMCEPYWHKMIPDIFFSRFSFCLGCNKLPTMTFRQVTWDDWLHSVTVRWVTFYDWFQPIALWRVTWYDWFRLVALWWATVLLFSVYPGWHMLWQRGCSWLGKYGQEYLLHFCSLWNYNHQE